ncbi:MAG: BBP7 family outer membrane beta-barrel protein [Pirellulales bacterium]|nr:BBP7 family outer membrane beta-barrel protein [Pirellulales bacterium]
MSLSRAKPWLAVWLLTLLTGASAFGQGVRDMQLFAPAEIDGFGNGARADEGFFFQFDGLYWWILPPDTDPVGFPDLTREVFYSPEEGTTQSNTIDNSNLTADAVGGQRYEFGCIRGHHGFMFSILDLTHQNQRLVYSDVDMVFNDVPFQHPGTGLHGHLHGYVSDVVTATTDDAEYENSVLRDLPVTFEEVVIRNRVSIWGTEADYIFRTHPAHHGGIFEILCGVRYFEFEERFSFEGIGDRFERAFGEIDEDTGEPTGAPIGPGTILDETFYWMDSRNHIIGPQFGLRWFRQSKRWTMSTEARFFAGFNIQNLKLEGTLGTELDEEDPSSRTQDIPVQFMPFVPLMRPVGFKHSRTEEEWSPGVELRFDLQYKLTRAVDFKVGWTGMWIDGIARSSNLIDYTLTENRIMGIDLKDNRQGVFMHGLNIGFNINR